MSMNPYVLELAAKQRQDELLTMARPQRIPIPLSNRRPLGLRLRAVLARLAIRIGWYLNPGCRPTPCQCHHPDGLLHPSAVEGTCRCPARGTFPDCPSLQCG